jgi:hypothetical protein
MKIITHILSYSIATILLACSTPDFSNLEGQWIAEGYNCENLTDLSEDINIQMKDSVFYATKITGDNCIPAGDTSWYGELNTDKITGKIKGINPQTNKYEWKECEIYESRGTLLLSIDKYIILQMKKK